MGCNYYWTDVDAEMRDDPRKHIGKRSAAGKYCWDCGVTLCREGTRGVHCSNAREWDDECPICDKTYEFDANKSAAFVELGFVKASAVPKVGVGSCSSFTWTMMAHKWRLEDMAARGDEAKVVEDENGKCYTAAEFLQCELASVAIESQDAGRFS